MKVSPIQNTKLSTSFPESGKISTYEATPPSTETVPATRSTIYNSKGTVTSTKPQTLIGKA